MAHSLSNICTRNYWNWNTAVKISLSLVVGWCIFSRHSVHPVYTVDGTSWTAHWCYFDLQLYLSVCL